MHEVDVTIIGAGVIGLAVSYYLSSGSERDIVVVERNPTFGQETSSRNSEVIHAGIYYPDSSIKAKTCIRGRRLLYDLCARYNIAHKKIGKLLVASDDEGITELERIYRNALKCNVKSLRFLERIEFKKLEPDIEASTVLFSPESGIIDSHGLMKFFYETCRNRNVDFAFSVEVTGIRNSGGLYEIVAREPNGETVSFHSRTVVNCAGLWSDKIAEMAGIDAEKHLYRIHYCKGQYFRIRNSEKFSIRHLIYPPPTKLSLGIHITPDLGEGLRIGPDAKYVTEVDYEIDEKDKGIFYESVRGFLPGLNPEDLIPDTAGIRPKLEKEGDGFRDFIISDEAEKGFPDLINLIGVDSPGLTACMGIAELVMQKMEM